MSNDHGAQYWCDQYQQLKAQTDAAIAEQKRTILDMKARTLQLVDALNEAQEWNWLDGDMPPDDVVKKIYNAVNSPSSTSEWTSRFVADWVHCNRAPDAKIECYVCDNREAFEVIHWELDQGIFELYALPIIK